MGSVWGLDEIEISLRSRNFFNNSCQLLNEEFYSMCFREMINQVLF